MRYLSRDALKRRIDDVVASATPATMRGFGLRSHVHTERGDPSDEDRARVVAALGADAGASRLLRFTVSTEKRASDGLALKMSGARLERYQRNPIVLQGHSWWARHPIGHSVVWTETSSDGVARMRAVASMLSRELSQALDRGFSWALGELYALRGGAASIGFDVLQAVPAPPDARAIDPWALDVDEWELVEWSLVTIPMDPDAVMEGRAAGLDMEPLVAGFERLLDELGAAGFGRAQLEQAWQRARGREPTGAPALSAEDVASAVRAALGQL
jgi:hypothetical protein